MKLAVCLTVFCMLFSGKLAPLAAQTEPDPFSSAAKVSISTHLSHNGVHAGGVIQAALQLDVERRWHINSHTPISAFLIGTEFLPEENPRFALLASRYPPAKEYRFAFSDDPVRVYEGTVYVYLELQAADDLQPGNYELRGQLRVQACDDQVCLAPSDKPVAITIPVLAATDPVQAIDAAIFSPQAMYTVGSASTDAASVATGELARMFDERGAALAFLAIFVIGLALNLTPCVYPMLTVTVSIFGSQTDVNTARVFGKALVYVLGICTMYSVLGLAAALSGGLFGGVLQSPWVLAGIGLLFFALALSMFGLYEIQMPVWLTSRLGGAQVAGNLGIYCSGLVVGVFAAPCIGPPIIALMALVGQRADPVFGFASFFVLSLGLGSPYLFLGTFSGLLKKLPKSGAWMVWVKKVFGVVLIAVGTFYLSLVFNPDLIYYLIPITLAAGGLYLGFLESTQTGKASFPWIKRATGVAAIAFGVSFYLAGQKPGLEWHPYSAELLQQTQTDSRPAALYFAADWCIPCLELDRLTFTNSRVIGALDGFTRLKVDLTNYDSPESQDLRSRFDISGVPTIVFLDEHGQELAGIRVIGYVPAADLVRRVETR